MDEFLTTVARMRKAQKDYFNTKDRIASQKAKALERLVDTQLIELLKEQTKAKDSPEDQKPFLLYPKGE